MTVDQWLTVIAAITAALVSLINAWRGRAVPQQVNALANRVGELSERVSVVSGSVARLRAETAPAPGAGPEAPSASITRVFALWGLLGKIIDNVTAVKVLPPRTRTQLDVVRTRIDGRMAKFGPCPFEWEE